MTKGERNMAIGVGGALAVWALNAFVVEPLMTARADIVNMAANERRELISEQSLVDNRSRYERVWEEYISKGLQSDPRLAVSQLVAHLNMWAGEQNLTVGAQTTNIIAQPVNRPRGRAGEREPGFMRVGAKYSVTGSMAQLANFLSRIQNADIPIRISELAIATKSEGQDNQELSLTVSTIIRQTEASGTALANAQQPRPATNPSTNPSSTGRQGGGQ